MKIRSFLFAAAALVSTATVVAPSSPEPQAHAAGRVFTVGVVTDSTGLAAGSTNQQVWAGARAAARKYHVHVQLRTSRSIGDYTANLTSFAVHGTGLVIAASPSMNRAIYTVASRYWKTRFAIVEAVPTNAKGRRVSLANVTDLWFRTQEPGFLAGVLAGLMERHRVGKAQHDIVGYLGGQATPSVTNYVTGFTEGARAVAPGIRILAAYSHSFSNRDAAGTIGKAQVVQGADILFAAAGPSGSAYMDAARSNHVYAIAADAGSSSSNSFVIASAEKRADVAIQKTILLAKRHRLSGGDHSFGLKDKATGLTGLSRVVPGWLQARLNRDARLIALRKIAVAGTIP